MKKLFLYLTIFSLALTGSTLFVSANTFNENQNMAQKANGNILTINLTNISSFRFSTIDYTKYDIINFEWTYPYSPNSDAEMGIFQYYYYELLPEITSSDGLNSTYNINDTITFKFNIKYTIDTQGTVIQDTNYSNMFESTLSQTSMGNLIGSKIIIING